MKGKETFYKRGWSDPGRINRAGLGRKEPNARGEKKTLSLRVGLKGKMEKDLKGTRRGETIIH